MFEEVLKMVLEVCGMWELAAPQTCREMVSMVALGKHHKDDINSHVERKMEAIRLSLGNVA